MCYVCLQVILFATVYILCRWVLRSFRLIIGHAAYLMSYVQRTVGLINGVSVDFYG